MSRYISLDFDGVIHSYTSPWQGACHIPDPPVPDALAMIMNYIDNGLRVGIFSTRNIEPGGIAAMQAWLSKHGLHEGYICKIDFPSAKPTIATLFVDDRAYAFTGTFPSVEYVKSFKPWNKPQ